MLKTNFIHKSTIKMFQRIKNFKRFIFCNEMPLFSNLSILDIVKIYSTNNFLPEDFMIIEEKCIIKNMLFYPEKNLSILRCLFLFFNKKKKDIKKIFECYFFFLSKYNSTFIIWKQSLNIISTFFNNYLKIILIFFNLFLFKSNLIFFTKFKFFIMLNNLNFFFIIFYFYKIKLSSSHIISYNLKNLTFKNQKTIFSIFSNSKKKNYYRLFALSKVFLLINFIFDKISLNLKINRNFNKQYIIKRTIFSDDYNLKFISKIFKINYKKIQKKIFNNNKDHVLFKNFELLFYYFQLYIFKIHEETIICFTKDIKLRINKINEINLNIKCHILINNKKKYNEKSTKTNNNAIIKNLIYINCMFDY